CCFTHVVIPKPVPTFGRHALKKKPERRRSGSIYLFLRIIRTQNRFTLLLEMLSAYLFQTLKQRCRQVALGEGRNDYDNILAFVFRALADFGGSGQRCTR